MGLSQCSSMKRQASYKTKSSTSASSAASKSTLSTPSKWHKDLADFYDFSGQLNHFLKKAFRNKKQQSACKPIIRTAWT